MADRNLPGQRPGWWRPVFLTLYLLFAIVPIYWMVNMSFKTNEEIVSTLSLWPATFTLEHYVTTVSYTHLRAHETS